jgi:exonuclease SbcD
MKIIILGDPHFGAGYFLGRVDPYRQLNSRLIDHSNIFDYVVDYAVDNDISHFIIAGDVYEHRRPEASQVGIFSEKLSKLADFGIHTHIVVGNHDLIQAHKTTTIDMLHKLKLPMVHVYSDIGSFYCEDEYGDVGINLIFFPYRNRHILQKQSNREAIKYLSECLDYELKAIDNSDPKVLVGHFALQSAKAHNSLLEQNAIYEIILPFSMFGKLDAVVMGHIHQYQELSQTPFIAHIGSMERTDFGESKYSKYFLELENNNGVFTHKRHKLPVRQLYDVVCDCTDPAIKEDLAVTEAAKKWLEQFADEHQVSGSIMRVEVLVNEPDATEIDTAKLMKFLIHHLQVGNCVSVFSTVISKRQLRDSTITEHLDNIDAFNKYLELSIDDGEIRDSMRSAGMDIIKSVKV